MPPLGSGGAEPTECAAGTLLPHTGKQTGDTRRAGDPGKGREVRSGSREHVKNQQAMGDSNTGTAVEGGRTGTRKDVDGVGLRCRAEAGAPWS